MENLTTQKSYEILWSKGWTINLVSIGALGIAGFEKMKKILRFAQNCIVQRLDYKPANRWGCKAVEFIVQRLDYKEKMRGKNLEVILGQKVAKNAFFVLSYEFNEVCKLVRIGKIIGMIWKF